MLSTTNNPLSQQPGGQPDHAPDSNNNSSPIGSRPAQSTASQAFDRMNEKVESVKNQAGPLIDRLTNQAETAARHGAEVVRETSAQLRVKAQKAQENTVGYIKEEPVKAMLIATATGAALMALISLMSRSRH